MTAINEADIESAALDLLHALGGRTEHEPNIAPDTPNTERSDYNQGVLDL